MASTNLNIRVDSELKSQAEALYAELGMNLSTALNLFMRSSVRYGGIPFELRIPNKPKGLEEYTQEEFDAKIDRSIEDYKAGRYRPAEEVFEEIRQRHNQRYGI